MLRATSFQMRWDTVPQTGRPKRNELQKRWTYFYRYYAIYMKRTCYAKYYETLIFSLFYDGWLDVSELVTYWTGMMLYEERMSTIWHHKKHDKARPTEGTTIQSRVKVSLLIFHFHFVFQFSFRFYAGRLLFSISFVMLRQCCVMSRL